MTCGAVTSETVTRLASGTITPVSERT